MCFHCAVQLRDLLISERCFQCPQMKSIAARTK